MGFKKFFEDIEYYFELGGKYEKWFVLYEVVVMLFYILGLVIKRSLYVCDSVDLKCIMIMVWFVVFLVMFWGMYNVGG